MYLSRPTLPSKLPRPPQKPASMKSSRLSLARSSSTSKILSGIPSFLPLHLRVVSHSSLVYRQFIDPFLHFCCLRLTHARCQETHSCRRQLLRDEASPKMELTGNLDSNRGDRPVLNEQLLGSHCSLYPQFFFC